jgi:hypothetical protein
MMVISTMLLLASAGADPNVSAARRHLQDLPYCTGNFDGDNDVDVNDLLNVLSSFMVDDHADTDGDGDTDIVDLLNVLAQFGAQECHEQQAMSCTEWDLHLVDSWGDGWNGNTLSVSDCEGNLLVTDVTLESGSGGSADVCIPSTFGSEENSGYVINAGGGWWQSEISWTLINSDGTGVVQGGAGYYNLCHNCGEGEWDFHMTDTYGNGWDCATAEITDCGGNVLMTGVGLPPAEGENCASWDIHEGGGFASGDVCVPAADGYTVTFTSGYWDGEIGWSLLDANGNVALAGGVATPTGDAQAPAYTTCPFNCPENQWDLHLADSFGDGWNGNTLSYYDCDGNLLISGVTLTGWTSSGSADICFDPEENFGIIVGGGNWQSEVSWELVSTVDGETTTIMEGGAGTFSTCESHFGCTSHGASNYNADALVDDGSCIFEAVCDIYEFDDDGVIYDVSDLFQCWSHPNCPTGPGEPYSHEAALVSDGVMTVIDHTDVITAWPPYVSGTVYVSWTMTVPTGSSGYWNFGNQMPNSGSGWGWEIQTFMPNCGGDSYIDAIEAGAWGQSVDFEMVFDEPILVEAWIDLDGGETHVNMNGVYELGWAWSGPFEGIDFYGLDCDGATAYTVDSVGIQLVDECGISAVWNDGQLEVGATTDGAGVYALEVTDDTASYSHLFDACAGDGTVSILPANMAAPDTQVNVWHSYGLTFNTCDDANMITSEADCQSAAAMIGVNYASSAGPEWQTGCLFHGGNAFYSPYEDGSTEDSTDGYICADLEYQVTYNQCWALGMITTEADCQSAAASLNVNYASSAGPEWHSGCLFHGGNAYYSPHEDGSSQNPTDAYICQVPPSPDCSTEVILTPGSYLAVTTAATAYSEGALIDSCGVPDGDSTTCAGCTDPTAENYVAALTVDDGSCWYVYPCDGDSLDLHMFDTFGDGWNGNTLTLLDCNGDPLAQALTSFGLPDSYTLDWGLDMGDQPHDVCLPTGVLDVGFILEVGGGSWQSEISWQLLGADGAVILPLDGGMGGVGSWNENCPVGCTNPLASNYNPDIAELEILDDGSCVMPCSGNDVDLHLFDDYGDGWNGNTLSLTDCEGNPLTEQETYTLDGGSSCDGSCADICISHDALYNGFILSIDTDNGYYASEISWTILDSSGETLLSGDSSSDYESCTYFPCGGDELDLHLFDDWGDGWNGNTISLTDCEGSLLTSQESFNLEEGSEGVADICIASDALSSGFILGWEDDGWYTGEISWQLMDASGNVLAAGAGEEVVTEGC